MNTLEALLAGIISDPLEETRWLVLADYLEENDDPRRGELLRLHRRLLATCCGAEQHPERSTWQARVVELIAAGVRPCVPQHTLTLPGGIALTASFIPPGQFLMGSALMDAQGEQPVHKVTLTKGFFLGIHLVTQAQWKAVMGTDPSHFKGPNRPVEQVSWEDCQEFCKNLMAHLKSRVTVRLPTEAEWEYACRAGTTTERITLGMSSTRTSPTTTGTLPGTAHRRESIASKQPRLARSHPMRGDCSTFTATSWNGAWIGTVPTRLKNQTEVRVN